MSSNFGFKWGSNRFMIMMIKRRWAVVRGFKFDGWSIMSLIN